MEAFLYEIKPEVLASADSFDRKDWAIKKIFIPSENICFTEDADGQIDVHASTNLILFDSNLIDRVEVPDDVVEAARQYIKARLKFNSATQAVSGIMKK